MNVLVFDTETTGLPKRFSATYTDVNNWPRITELGFSISNLETEELLFEWSSLVKPDGWIIPNVEYLLSQGLTLEDANKKGSFFTENGMSIERCETYGSPIFDVLMALGSQINYFNPEIIVCHNVSFDKPILLAEFIRLTGHFPDLINFLLHTKYICIMSDTKQLFPGGRGRGPSLSALHQSLFNEGIPKAHNALPDVTATRNCFHKLHKMGVIRI